jgi:hypothetical protein
MHRPQAQEDHKGKQCHALLKSPCAAKVSNAHILKKIMCWQEEG